jgi:hypothetical protein
MLSAILQKNNGDATPRINPQSIGFPRRPFQSRSLLGNLTILISGMHKHLEDANSSENKVKKISRKLKRVSGKLTFQLHAC